MNLTCLSKGGGYYFPPNHILDIGGFRILLECPIDLSALVIFAPIPTDSNARRVEAVSGCSSYVSSDSDSYLKRQTVDTQLDVSQLIKAVPWYKTVSTLKLWNISSIDVVLISSPMGMLGLPFLTCHKGFSAKVYATEVTKKLGQLMMEDLVSMHTEFEQFYGPERSDFPQWMRWEELEMLPHELKDKVLGKDGVDLGGWSALYSSADVKDSVQTVQSLKYGEEVCYNGIMVIKAFSSGLDIGTSNWTINSPIGNVVYLCGSLFSSTHAKHFNYQALEGHDALILSDFASLNGVDDSDSDANLAPVCDPVLLNHDDNGADIVSSIGFDESLEEANKLAFICSCALESLKAGGSVLITIGRLNAILQLLDHISVSPEFKTSKVPVFVISAVSEELLSFTNIIPEWLSKQKQEKLFAGEPLFAHVDLLEEGRLHVFSSVCSLELLALWQEPCIVFCPHWSLRLGPVVHFLRRWHEDKNSLLIMERGVDADLALLPFRPLRMRILQCSFLSGMRSQFLLPLLGKLQSNLVLLHEDLRTMFGGLDTSSLTFYSEKETLFIPNLKRYSELQIDAALASQFKWRILEGDGISITRLTGNLVVENGKYQLLLTNEAGEPQHSRSYLRWGSVHVGRLLVALQKLGINGSIDQAASDDSGSNLSVHEDGLLYVEVDPSATDSWKLEPVIKQLKEGAVGVIPTDTVYALVCDINSHSAVERLRRIKKIDASKPLSILCRSFHDIGVYTMGFPRGDGHGHPNIFRAVKHCLPGPYTFILTASKELPRQCIKYDTATVKYASRKTIGVRMPDDPICKAILEKIDSPLISTSVKSQKEDEWIIDPVAIADTYGGEGLDFIVDAGRRVADPSTVVDMTGSVPKIIRQGKGPRQPWMTDEDDNDSHVAGDSMTHRSTG